MSLTSLSRPSDAQRFDQTWRERMGRARESFLSGDTESAGGVVPPEIFSSWVRSHGLGVDPACVDVPMNEHAVTRSRRLLEAAEPVMKGITDQCRDADAWGMLLDRDCVQISPIAGDARVVREGELRGGGVGAVFNEALVGTNGAGISAERLESFLVVGEEHFRVGERNLASVGAPVRDPYGRLVGFLLMCQRLSTANHMIVPYTQSLARAVEEQLARAADGDQRALFEAFSGHSRRPSLAVVGINDDVFVANNAAQQLLRDGAQNDALRDAVLEVARQGRSRLITVDLGDERFRVHCRVVELSRGRFGAVASLTRTAQEGTPHRVSTPDRDMPVDAVSRAYRLGLPVLSIGERGAGRARRLTEVVDLAEIDAAGAAADWGAWFERFSSLLTAGTLLVRNIDVLPTESRARVLEAVRFAKNWVAATAQSATAELGAAFPVSVSIEPLRMRTAEIPAIVASVLAELGAAETRVSPDAMSILCRHAWPGNIAQLRQVLASTLVHLTGSAITVEALPRQLADSGRRAGDEGILARTERELIFDALRAANWNRDAAAQALGISRATMYRRIKQFGFVLRSSR